jgi:hypothetical protein
MRKTMKSLVRIVTVLTQIRSGHLPEQARRATASASMLGENRASGTEVYEIPVFFMAVKI